MLELGTSTLSSLATGQFRYLHMASSHQHPKFKLYQKNLIHSIEEYPKPMLSYLNYFTHGQTWKRGLEAV